MWGGGLSGGGAPETIFENSPFLHSKINGYFFVIYLKKSQIDSRFLEIREGNKVLREIEVLFSLRRFPKSFPSFDLALAWLKKIETKLAKAKAYRLLAMKNYPSELLLDKLVIKGFSKSVCEHVIKDLKALGYLDDEEYWESLIRTEFKKGHGPRYLEWKKRVPREKIRALISDEMLREKIRELLPRYPTIKKAVRALIQRGFDLECIRAEVDLFS
jgi:SOS response regulatory protein OraA/RecX